MLVLRDIETSHRTPHRNNTTLQRTSLAEEALDALCEAIDPCLLMQPVASLAQYGNARLKVLIYAHPHFLCAPGGVRGTI